MANSASQIVFVDVEVAGAEISRPIIQVAAVAVASNFAELETFESKLTFDKRLADPNSLTKKRYDAHTWAVEPRMGSSADRAFSRFLRRNAFINSYRNGCSPAPVAQLVAHNAQFDGPFIRAWFERVGRFFPGDYRMLCTVQRALWLFYEHPQLRPPTDF